MCIKLAIHLELGPKCPSSYSMALFIISHAWIWETPKHAIIVLEYSLLAYLLLLVEWLSELNIIFVCHKVLNCFLFSEENGSFH